MSFLPCSLFIQNLYCLLRTLYCFSCEWPVLNICPIHPFYQTTLIISVLFVRLLYLVSKVPKKITFSIVLKTWRLIYGFRFLFDQKLFVFAKLQLTEEFGHYWKRWDCTSVSIFYSTKIIQLRFCGSFSCQCCWLVESTFTSDQFLKLENICPPSSCVYNRGKRIWKSLQKRNLSPATDANICPQNSVWVVK